MEYYSKKVYCLKAFSFCIKREKDMTIYNQDLGCQLKNSGAKLKSYACIHSNQ